MPVQRLWAECSLRTPATLNTEVSSPAMFSSRFQWSDNVFRVGGGRVSCPRSEDIGGNAVFGNAWIACGIIGGCSFGLHSSGEGAVCGSGLAALRDGWRKYHNRRPGKIRPHEGASEK